MTEYLTPEIDETSAACPPERRLMQAVVIEAVIDALSRKQSKDRDDAREWILSAPESFETACDCAGWDAEFIRRSTQHNINAGKLLRRTTRGIGGITEADVLEIRASAESNSTLSGRFDVDPTTISHIRTGRSWRNVPMTSQKSAH